METIQERVFAFGVEADESSSFQLERPPTMYLTDMGVSGLDASPAWFHVLTEYRLDLIDDTWQADELNVTFEYAPWMIVAAELGLPDIRGPLHERITDVATAADPAAAFDDAFGPMIDHWADKFSELDGRTISEEETVAIIDLLVDMLEERAEID